MKLAMSSGMRDLARGLLIIALLAIPLVFPRAFLVLPGFLPVFVSAGYYVGVLLYSVVALNKMRVQREEQAKRRNEVLQTAGGQAK